jgi:hypothetical protein
VRSGAEPAFFCALAQFVDIAKNTAIEKTTLATFITPPELLPTPQSESKTGYDTSRQRAALDALYCGAGVPS